MKHLSLQEGAVFAKRYRIVRQLSSGGMGSVLEAQHTTTERRVALKILHAHIVDSPQARKAFDLEARVAARVNCPFLVSILDAGVDESTEYPFLVMELLKGETLQQRVKNGQPSPQDVIRWVQQMAIGLDAAHGYRDEAGKPAPIIHRDLKPENVFLHQGGGGEEQIRILDFGIAKLITETAGAISQEVKGTPLFMAFEQLTSRPVSSATDIWSLGLMTFYLLTGRHYWLAAQQVGASSQAVFAELLSLPLEPPSIRIAKLGFAAEFPRDFDAWYNQCVNRNPAERFASAGQAAAELANIFSNCSDIRLVESRRSSQEPESAQTLSMDGAEGARREKSATATAPGLSPSFPAAQSTSGRRLGLSSRVRAGLSLTAVLTMLGAGVFSLLVPEVAVTVPVAVPAVAPRVSAAKAQAQPEPPRLSASQEVVRPSPKVQFAKPLEAKLPLAEPRLVVAPSSAAKPSRAVRKKPRKRPSLKSKVRPKVKQPKSSTVVDPFDAY